MTIRWDDRMENNPVTPDRSTPDLIRAMVDQDARDNPPEEDAAREALRGIETGGTEHATPKPLPFRGDRDSVNAPGNSEDMAAAASRDAERHRQEEMGLNLRVALLALEGAADLAPDYTPEGQSLRDMLAEVDSLATDAERRAKS
jgi:hypothetical protein